VALTLILWNGCAFIAEVSKDQEPVSAVAEARAVHVAPESEEISRSAVETF